MDRLSPGRAGVTWSGREGATWPPILFAHRGASGRAPENTLEAFELAVALGATGLETDTWLSADGVPVLSHDRTYRRPGRRPSVARSTAATLAADGIPSLAELYARVGTALPVSIDLQHPEVAEPVLAVATEARAIERLICCSGDIALLARVRAASDAVRLAHSTRPRRVPEGLPTRLGVLAGNGVDILNMPWQDWTPARVALTRRAGLRPWAWDAHGRAGIERALDLGVEAIYSDHPDLLVAALAARAGPPGQPGR
ncbi:MAG: glycerophosphodiester phosphodiesterase [Candidatus Limnocylindrales bacterium]